MSAVDVIRPSFAKRASAVVLAVALATGFWMLGAAPAHADDVPVVPPVFTEPTCATQGTILGVDTEHYTWAYSGNMAARMATATATPGNTLTTQNVFGPYNLNYVNYMNTECRPVITGTSPSCGVAQVTYVNNSRWPRWPDYRWDGDGVSPIDYGSGPTYTNVNVLSQETLMIVNHTFPEDFNGGSTTVTYQDILGAERDIDTAAQSFTVITDCLPPGQTGAGGQQSGLADTGAAPGGLVALAGFFALTGVVLVLVRRRAKA